MNVRMFQLVDYEPTDMLLIKDISGLNFSSLI